MLPQSVKKIFSTSGAVALLTASSLGISNAESAETLRQFFERTATPQVTTVADSNAAADASAQPPKPAEPTIEDDHGSNPNPPVASGDTQSITLTTKDGTQRRYIMHVGANYNPDKPNPIPVLFSFHGWDQSVDSFMESSAYQNTRAWNDAIVIYPEALDGAWEAAPYATGRPGKDLAFVEDIIADVDNDYLIDRHRVYASGFSNGGGMAAVVGCHLPDKFAAFASVSGAYYQQVNVGCSERPIPAMIVHNVDDPVVHYKGGPRNGGQLIPVYEVAYQYAHRNHCDLLPPTSSDITNGTRLTFNNCEEPTQHIRVNVGGHTWPRNPDIAFEAWQFLSSQAR